MADALLIEMYTSLVRRAGKTDRCCFVTSNHRDFSALNGDRRLPHPDLSEIFDGKSSQYVYQVEGLDAVLTEHLDGAFLEEKEEAEFLATVEEPRTLEDILEAESEYFDRVWYVRSIVGSTNESDNALPEDIRRGMLATRAEVEKKYGRKNLRRPIGESHEKAWEYGYINGKLSALRWVLGSDWDFLDT